MTVKQCANRRRKKKKRERERYVYEYNNEALKFPYCTAQNSIVNKKLKASIESKRFNRSFSWNISRYWSSI